MTDRNVLVTGAHTGLGHALATRCLDDGARVWAVSRREPEDLFGRDGWRFASLDLARHETIRPVLEKLLCRVESLDLVVLNAGVLGPIRDLAAISHGEIRSVMDVNVWANKEIIDGLFALGMAPRQVIGISSGASKNGSGGWGPYSISKSALNLLLRVYANEHPDTHFASVAPGLVDTPMTREVRRQSDDPRHPATARVRGALEAGHGSTPAAAAGKLLSLLDSIRDRTSGSYVDVRDL
jgi:benzil reductase ((S)-benzoin forming)